MERETRVRFAPSPTGYLHVGGARTALFNYLFARNTGGKFILRIEDTDLERSSEEAMRDILQGLRWLGLEWDEGPQVGGDSGPYFQAERIDLYTAYMSRLEHDGLAYRCYCTTEELSAERERAVAEGREYKYNGKCRRLTPDEREQRSHAGISSVLRFAMTPGTTIVDDMVRGRVSFDNALLDDFVIVKSDGMATYNFAVVVDDALMGITHVIRGEDHLSNTPRQILLYKALGFDLPRFAHIPLIMGPDRTRLSKRHGATAVTSYRDQGVLPQAMINFLALLGWGYGDKQLFDMAELCELFSIERVNKNPAVFDTDKLEWMNGQYIRAMNIDDLYKVGFPYFLQAGLVSEEPNDRAVLKCKEALRLVQDRLRYLSEIPDLTVFFFKRPGGYEPGAANKWFTHSETAVRLEKLVSGLQSIVPFNAEAVETLIRNLASMEGIKAGELIHPVRLALTGRKASPGIFETMELIGRDECVLRLQKAMEFIKERI
ncbi:MAG: glutamate--tRNA ligase [bacterium]|nr:glutamate--tRNA ligase [bacterium]MDD4153748.1 glutamate--tRNA ligase [bacterium]